MVDPIFFGIVGAVILFFFFLFLMIRRAVTGFREGLDSGHDRK